MFPNDLHLKIHQSGVMAVVNLENDEIAAPLAGALVAGGVDIIEVTLRGEHSMDAIRRIVQEVPQMSVVAGTVLNIRQVKEVKAAGAAFAVSPGLSPEVVKAAREADLPFAPGVCTPTEVLHAVSLGCTVLKFFPCGSLGGLPYLRNVAAPFAHLGVKYLPLGGVDVGNLEEHLREPSVLAAGGSWLVTPYLIKMQDWAEVTRRAQAAARIVRTLRGGPA